MCRDEAWVTVMVAMPAEVSLYASTIQEKKVVAVSGERLEVACLVKRGHPAPTISIWVNKSSGLAQLGEGASSVSYYPTMQDSGSMFICKWEQV